MNASSSPRGGRGRPVAIVISLIPLLLALSWGEPALARDAYDDQRRPERLDQDRHDPGDEQDDTPRAGGLSAPESMPRQGEEPSEIEKELNRSDERDAQRGLQFVWLEATLGYQWLTLDGLAARDFVPDVESTERSLFAWSVAGGVRLLYFTLGARFRNSNTPLYQFWTLAGEAALRVPLGAWEPYGGVGLGAAKVGKLQVRGERFDEGRGELTKIHGLTTRLFGGMDYYFSDSFSVGANVTGDLLFLTRPEQSDNLCTDATDCVYLERGRSTGLSVTTSVELGLHF